MKTFDRLCAGLLLVFVVLAATVSLANPLFEAPDEIRHYRYVRKLVTEHHLPIQGQEEVRSQSHHPPLYYALAALASAWVPSPHTSTYEHPSNPFWGYRNWEVGVDNKLQYWHGDAERFPFRAGFLAVLISRWVNVRVGRAHRRLDLSDWATRVAGCARAWRWAARRSSRSIPSSSTPAPPSTTTCWRRRVGRRCCSCAFASSRTAQTAAR
jgi:hypothetical protein